MRSVGGPWPGIGGSGGWVRGLEALGRGLPRIQACGGILVFGTNHCPCSTLPPTPSCDFSCHLTNTFIIQLPPWSRLKTTTPSSPSQSDSNLTVPPPEWTSRVCRPPTLLASLYGCRLRQRPLPGEIPFLPSVPTGRHRHTKVTSAVGGTNGFIQARTQRFWSVFT